jgi:hypothetical protein
MFNATVWPFIVADDVANVIAPACAEPYDCARERRPVFAIVTAPVEPETEIPLPEMLEVTPVFAMTPVALLYEMPVPAERLVLEILLLKSVQSPEARYPFVLPLAEGIEIVLPTRLSGALKVSGFS